MLHFLLIPLYPAVPELVVSLSTPGVTLLVNTSDRTELLCNASFNSTELDHPERIHFNFTWSDFNGREIHNGSRISVSYPTESTSVLSVFPLNVLDTNISCTVAITQSLLSSYVRASPAKVAMGNLTIQCEF